MAEMQSSVVNHLAPFKHTIVGTTDCEPGTIRFVLTYLHFLQATEQLLADSLMATARRHACTVDAHDLCLYLARYSQSNAASLTPFIQRYALATPGMRPMDEVRSVLLDGSHLKELTLLMDLQDIALLANQARLGWTILQQAASVLKDHDLLQATSLGSGQTKQQLRWLENYIKLVVVQHAMAPAPWPA